MKRLSPSLTKTRIFWGFTTFALLIFFGWRAWKAGNNDFIAYYNAGSRVLLGKSPYAPLEPTPFRYLPMTAYFFAPFAWFPFSIARLLFFTANFCAAAFIYRKIGEKLGGLAVALLLVLFFRFHNHDFQNAQVNPLLLLLFFAWWRWRERNAIFSSIAFTIFASFKLIPFALGLPLLFFRRWNEIVWIGIWTVVLNFLPVFFLENGPFVFQDWYDQAKLIQVPVMLSNVQSLQSALWWLLEGHLATGTFTVVMHAIEVAVLIGILVGAPKKEKENWVIASTLAATAILAPLAWKHNYLQLLPLACLWFYADPELRTRPYRILYGIAAFGLVFLPSSIATWNRGFSDRLYLMPWTGLLLIFLGLAFERKRQMLPIEK